MKLADLLSTVFQRRYRRKLPLQIDSRPVPELADELVGFMVNYLYDLHKVYQNHKNFVTTKEVAATADVKALAGTTALARTQES